MRGVLAALVVLPTRELAVQVYDVFASLCPGVGLWVGLAAARLPLAAEAAALGAGSPNILIATPGRLMSHLKAAKPTLSLQDLSFLVGVPLYRHVKASVSVQMSQTAGRDSAGPSPPSM